MKKLFTLFVLFVLFTFHYSFAQVSTYTFSQSTGTYSEITGGTVIATATGTTGAESLDDVIYNLPNGTIPFDFYFNGILYSGFNLSTNGFITFGATAPGTTTYLPISATLGYEGAFSGVGRDLQGAYGTTASTTSGSNVLTNVAGFAGVIVGRVITGTGIPANTTITAFDATAQTITISNDATATGATVTVTVAAGELRYEVLGTAPNRVFVVQFKNFRKFAGATDNFNFQIRLYETTFAVETVYGNFISNATSTTIQAGLRGLANADFNNRSSTTDWSATTAGATNTASITLNATVLPTSGLTFTWTSPNFGPSISYTPLPNTSLLGNRSFNNVLISDPDGVASGTFAPRVYWRVNSGSWLSSATTSSSSPYDFVIATTGLAVGDTVQYFVVAQDGLGIVTANPSAGFTATDVNTITSYPTSPNSYLITDVPLSGDYTVGLLMFRQMSGLDITFEKRTRTVEIEETSIAPEFSEKIGIYEETLKGTVTVQEAATEKQLIPFTITRTVEQEYYVAVINGNEYEGSLSYEFTPQQIEQYSLNVRGVYATITAAINDAVLRGVSGAVRFLLTDSSYPSETFPIVLGLVNGASSSNTISILPNVDVTVSVIGSIAQPLFDINGGSYFIFDGRQNGLGTNNSFTISNTSTSASAMSVRFINGSTNNIIRYINLIGMPSASATRPIEFSTSVTNPLGNSNNLISNCDINGGRYSIYFNGTAANPNSNNIVRNSKIYDATFAHFYMLAGSSNTTIEGNEIYCTTAQTTANSAINLSASALGGVNNIIGNKIYDLQNTSTTTVRGITGIPAAGSTLNIINNFISLTLDNGTKTSVYAIQISGTTEHTANIHYNTIRIGGIHTGGGAGSIVSGGLVKSNTGATSTFNAKNNISLNQRIGGGTETSFHTNFFAGPTNLVGTLDIDYNVNWAEGDTIRSFHSGWAGFLYNDQQVYRDSAAPQEQNTIFKNVEFVSTTDLHLAGSSVGDQDLAGIPIAGITTDIDGEPRDPEVPYRGADESESLNIPPIVNIWERSAANSTLPTWFGTDTERGLAYGFTSDGTEASNHRLYVVSRNAGLNVRILDAVNGTDVGTLNVTGISGGTFALNDIGVTNDGRIIGANLVSPSGDLKFYMWDNELSVPVNIFTYTSTVRLGDKITVTGNYSDGSAQIWAASATTGQHLIYKWTMSSGVFNQVPQVITCSDALTTPISAAAVGPLPNGEFYWNANGQNARKYAADGTLIGIIPGGIVGTGSNAIRYLGQVGGSEYVVTFAYGAGNQNARILELPLGDPTQALLYAVTPVLGSNNNINGAGDVDFQVNPDLTVNVFVLSTNNGLGAYKSSSVLPVELSTFVANVVDRTVTLNWRTESESNSLGFEVERNSTNQSWSQIGFVKSAGNSVTTQNYSFVDSKLETGSYSYRLKMVDLDGSFSYSNVVEVEIGTPVTFSLSQNYPNPFNPTTRIEYQVPFNANVKIELYSITGEKVATLINSDLSAGFYTKDIDASVLRLASGVYFYRMTSTDVKGSTFMDTKKMVLLK